MQAGHDMKRIAIRATPMLATLVLLACSSPMPVWEPHSSSAIVPAPPSAPPASGPSESAAVAARFPDPVVNYATPAFQAGHEGYTSNGEMRNAIHQIVDDAYSNSTAQTPTSIRLIEV